MDRLERSVNWTIVAQAWIEVFHDKKEARRCLDEAESRADDSSDWTRIAEVWENHGDKRKAKECLAKGD